MNKKALSLCLIIFLGVLALQKSFAHETSPSASKGDLIGDIEDLPLFGGCGIYLQKSKGDVFVFVGNIGGTPATMNIDGRDTKLEMMSDGNPENIKKKGLRFTRQYTADEMAVQADFLITRVCGSKREKPELIECTATVTVKKGGRKETIPVRGTCGCIRYECEKR